MKPPRGGTAALATTATVLMVTSFLVSPDVAYGAGGQGNGWGTGSLGPGGASVAVGDSRAPTPSVPPAPDPAPSSNGGKWVDQVCTDCAGLTGQVCNAAAQLVNVPPGGLPAGDNEPVVLQLVLPNGTLGYEGPLDCAPPPPPPPPSAAAVWSVAPFPAPQIELNPSSYGLAQLPTWFWLANDAHGVDLTAAVPGGIDGYSVDLTAHPVAYYWSFGDGQTGVSDTAGSAGSAARASTTHTYVDMGTFSVGVIVAWAGSYTFTGYGVTETVALGPVDQAEAAHPYLVQNPLRPCRRRGPS